MRCIQSFLVDWSIEAKTAKVTNDNGILLWPRSYNDAMVRWCKHCDRNEENDENNCFDPLSGEEMVFSDAKSDAKCCGWPKLAPSWAKLNPSWPKLAASWFKFAPNGPQVGASWPQLGPSQLQVSPS